MILAVNFKECLLQRTLKGKVQGNVITNFPMLHLVNFIQYLDPKLGSDLEVEDITLTSYEDSTFEWIVRSNNKKFRQIWNTLEARVDLLNKTFDPLDIYLRIDSVYNNWKAFRIIYKDKNLFTVDDDILIQEGFSYLVNNPGVLYPAFVHIFQKCTQNNIHLNLEEMEDFLKINIEYSPGESETLYDIRVSLNKPEQEYIEQIHSENPSILQSYKERHQHYSELYPKLKLLFPENNLLTPYVRLILE